MRLRLDRTATAIATAMLALGTTTAAAQNVVDLGDWHTEDLKGT